MNFRTTLVLAIALVVVVAVFFFTGLGEKDIAIRPPEAPTELLAKRPLLEGEYDDVVKVVCQPRSGEDWVFERQPDEDGELTVEQWRMTAPLQADASGWLIDGLVRRLTQLKYQVKYAAGSSGAVSATQAGLDQPVCVNFETQDGTTVTVDIGHDLSDREAYVRLGDSDDVYVVNSALGKLLRERAIEYRRQELLQFDPQDVTEIEIVDEAEPGQESECRLVRSDSGWVFESPAKARAITSKIDEFVRSLSTLRVAEWVEADMDDPGIYGFDAELTKIQLTVTEEPEPALNEEEAEADESAVVDDSAEDEAEPVADDQPATPAEPVVREFAVHVSRRSPLGQDTKNYVRLAGDSSVGTITTVVADKLRPDLAAWRDMRLITSNVGRTDRVELVTPQGKATFVKKQNEWYDADTDHAVDRAAVQALLDQVKTIKAVAFVPIQDLTEGDLGLGEPQAVIRLNVPGEPEAEVLTIGGFTDETTRRLVYVRYGQTDAVAKVRVADVEPLWRPPSAYQDRAVFKLDSGQIEKMRIARIDELTSRPRAYAVQRTAGQWELAEPVSAKTATQAVTKLVETLRSLRATQVLPDSDPSRYGLDNPAVTCVMTHQPPTVTKYVQVPVENEDAEDSEEVEPEDDESAPAEPEQPKTTLQAEKHTPPAVDYELHVARVDGKVYCRRADRPTVFEVEPDLFEQLTAELRDPVVLNFQEPDVVAVRGPDEEGSLVELRKVNDTWQYTLEPDLPIDAKKVTELILRIRDLKPDRFVTYGQTDPAELGVAWGPEVSVELTDGARLGLLVSGRVCENDPQQRRYATTLDHAGVFLLPADAVQRFEVDLAELEAP